MSQPPSSSSAESPTDSASSPPESEPASADGRAADGSEPAAEAPDAPGERAPDAAKRPAKEQAARAKRTLGGSTLLQLGALVLVLLLFFTSLEMMGEAFKLMGAGFAEALLETTSNPFVALFTGILATSLVQSSSTVTSLTVALVASGALTIPGAIPVIMGANIGTTVTNTIVSMGHISQPQEFRRAMAGATVHDFFNWLAVLLLLPLELIFGLLSRPAQSLADGIAGAGGTNLLSPLEIAVEPLATGAIGLLQQNGIAVLVVGLLGLFLALRYLVVLLKALVLGRVEKYLDRYIFGRPMLAMLFGVLLTFFVQSSSVTTSMVVPLIGAGILTVRQVFPYMLGANIGTTLTALLAALALSATATAGEADNAQAALVVACAHVLFNVIGIVAIYPVPPLREIPIRMAEFIGELAYKNRVFAIVYLALLFYALPLLLELIF